MAKSQNADILLDASALIAMVTEEPGAETVMEYIGAGASISSVNLAEVISKLIQLGVTVEEVAELTKEPRLTVLPFDTSQALLIPIFQPFIKSHNLSLADRICLSVAIQKNYTVITTDKTFAKLPLDIRVKLIR